MIGTKLAHCGTTSHIESRGIGVPLVQPANVGGILWRMFWNHPVLAFSAFLIMTNLLRGADGDLDISFGSSGSAGGPPALSGTARAVALQPDGKIVVAGWTAPYPGNDFAVARFNIDGSLD